MSIKRNRMLDQHWRTQSRNGLLQTMVVVVCFNTFFGMIDTIMGVCAFFSYFAIKTISLNCICFNRPRGISHLNLKCVSFWKIVLCTSHSCTPLKWNNMNMSNASCARTTMIPSDDKIWYKTEDPFQQRLLFCCIVFFYYLVCVSSFITSFLALTYCSVWEGEKRRMEERTTAVSIDGLKQTHGEQ